MMRALTLIPCLLLLAAFQVLADDEEPVEINTEPFSGEGVILEFDHNETGVEQEPAENRERKTRRTGGIEMIVGGQGEDGIAKRKQLQVID